MTPRLMSNDTPETTMEKFFKRFGFNFKIIVEDKMTKILQNGEQIISGNGLSDTALVLIDRLDILNKKPIREKTSLFIG